MIQRAGEKKIKEIILRYLPTVMRAASARLKNIGKIISELEQRANAKQFSSDKDNYQQ